jgi:hypothetical protein
MGWMSRYAAWAMLVVVGTLGCAPAARVGSAGAAGGVPFAMTGDNTRLVLDFSAHPPSQTSRSLGSGEICFISAGPATIICLAQGSYLLLGQDDGVELLASNPVWHLRAASDDPSETALLRGFGTILLIAGSVDRLPGALADYMDEPGAHRREATVLARKLLADGGAELSGVARGGTFKVSVRLTTAGRDKLLEAIHSLGDENGIQMVRFEPPSQPGRRYTSGRRISPDYLPAATIPCQRLPVLSQPPSAPCP